MEVFPELHTPRLTLRKIGLKDVPSLVKYANNKNIADHILNIPYPYGEPDAIFRISYVHQGFKNRTRYVFAIILQERDEFIGEISLHLAASNPTAQLAYWIAEPFWNKGLATEAARVIISFGMETLNMALIFAECRVDNKASQKVLLKCGLKARGGSGGVVRYTFSRRDSEEKDPL